MDKKWQKSFSCFLVKVFLWQLILEAFPNRSPLASLSKDFPPHRNRTHRPIWLFGNTFCSSFIFGNTSFLGTFFMGHFGFLETLLFQFLFFLETLLFRNIFQNTFIAQFVFLEALLFRFRFWNHFFLGTFFKHFSWAILASRKHFFYSFININIS